MTRERRDGRSRAGRTAVRSAHGLRRRRDWPEPERDPAKLEEARRSIAADTREMRQKVLRYVYAGLAILLIVVILLATLR